MIQFIQYYAVILNVYQRVTIDNRSRAREVSCLTNFIKLIKQIYENMNILLRSFRAKYIYFFTNFTRDIGIYIYILRFVYLNRSLKRNVRIF